MKQVITPILKMKCANGGFSLIEMMVSTAIFSVVSIVAIGAIFTINDANRKAQAIRAVVDNLNVSLESMSRKISMGSNFFCGGTINTISGNFSQTQCSSPDVSEGSFSLALVTTERLTGDPTARQGGAAVVYELKGGDNCDPKSSGCVLSSECNSPSNSNNISCRGKIVSSTRTSITPPAYGQVLMTPPEVNIKDLRFFLRGDGPGDQPRVIVAISGEIDLVKENLRTPFSLQTTISQRIKN
ncbi:MAG: prepilin-type N-terminal cleavage/methylation domain-containing protein [Candidatus Vogelbacteria bacterium]|nr:prepilin-type N-terminal cleavage/methylation domain-containing protein [Candidatus Vogelbacteria bacterium]